MRPQCANPLVHLELHTGSLAHACAFYTRMFDWPPERLQACSRRYLSLDLGALGGGMVECGTERPLWLPYVRVPAIGMAAQLAQELGASVLLEPSEGPGGWRCVVSDPAAGQVALWQPKRG